MSRLRAYLAREFTLDLRALAYMRMMLAAVLLLDIGVRITDLRAFYTDEGVFPSGLVDGNWLHLQIHTLFKGAWWPALLFGVEALAAVCLMLGLGTRVAAIVCWFLLSSLQYRNPYILQGGDDLLRMALFFGIFLPWGRMYRVPYSVFRVPFLRETEHGTPNTEHGFAYRGLPGWVFAAQVAFVYLFSALLKNSPEWHTEGTALYYALSLDQMALPLGKLLQQFPALCKGLTLFTFWVELICPLFFFVPWKNQFFRGAGIFFLVGFHLCIGLTLFVGLFFLIGISTLVGLAPSSWIDFFEQKILRLKPHPAARQEEIPQEAIPHNPKSQSIYATIFDNLRWFRDVALCALLGYITFWNVGQTSYSGYEMQDEWRALAHLLHLDQTWGMFAPRVFKDDGWYILEGDLTNGRTIDLNRNGAPLSYAKPRHGVFLFKNDRWRKFSENMLFISNTWLRYPYCAWTLREWNKKHPDRQVQALRIVYMKEVTAPDYRPVKAVREELAACTK